MNTSTNCPRLPWPAVDFDSEVNDLEPIGRKTFPAVAVAAAVLPPLAAAVVAVVVAAAAVVAAASFAYSVRPWRSL